MDISLLEAFFNEQQLRKYVWGPSKKSETCLSWKQMNYWEKLWFRQRAITAHQPNSILGQILIEGDENLLRFALPYFSICAKVVNKLKIGVHYAVERLARVGRLSLL